VDGLTIGFGLGFLVALQLGPMSLFLIRCTLRSGIRVGLAIGAGIAVVDALYAAAGAAGVAPLLRIEPLGLLLALTGGIVLIYLGARTLWSVVHVHTGTEGFVEVGTPARAFWTAVLATAANPSTIASWAAIFAAATAATSAAPIPLVTGVALGSASWVTLLACLIAAVRRRVPPRVSRVADMVAGTGLIGFGSVLTYRAATAEGTG
jgi:putative LysE/RhtB family amino acid efflux pump